MGEIWETNYPSTKCTAVRYSYIIVICVSTVTGVCVTESYTSNSNCGHYTHTQWTGHTVGCAKLEIKYRDDNGCVLRKQSHYWLEYRGWPNLIRTWFINYEDQVIICKYIYIIEVVITTYGSWQFRPRIL